MPKVGDELNQSELAMFDVIPIPPPMPEAPRPVDLTLEELELQLKRHEGDLLGRCVRAREEIELDLLQPDLEPLIRRTMQALPGFALTCAQVQEAPMSEALRRQTLNGLVRAADHWDYTLERDLLVGSLRRLLVANERVQQAANRDGVQLGTRSGEARVYGREIAGRLRELDIGCDPGRGRLHLAAQNASNQLRRVNNQLRRQLRFGRIEKEVKAWAGLSPDRQDLGAAVLSEARAKLQPDDDAYFLTMQEMNTVVETAREQLV